LRFRGSCYRAHDPRWSFAPLSGAGAAIHGGRFNPAGVEALYLSLSPMTAVLEMNQSFPFKIEPCVLCSYEVDCDDIVDLRSDDGRTEHAFPFEVMSAPWFSAIAEGREPETWAHVRRLIGLGAAGILVPSFARRAGAADQNLVLWRWGELLPHRITVYDPSGRLPKNQLSWD
jgi:RES domain-containing protein